MTRLSLVIWLLVFTPITFGQPILRLSLKQAIEMATSPDSNASIQLADTARQAAEARLAYARSLLFPVIETSVGESNLTRNLSAEGFNFPTGVPNFTIPAEVGPFNNFDARVQMSMSVFDLAAIRRGRGLRASLDAAKADVKVHRELSAAQVAHDYLLALRADSSVEAAKAGVALADSLLKLAQDRAEVGKAAELEVTRAKLRLSSDRRRISAAENDRAQAHLQLLGDLGLAFTTPLELTDHLSFTGGEAAPDAATALATALQSRPELQVSQKREEEARDNDDAIRGERVPVVTAFGDVGPLAAVITHTVGVTARITLFDGGRRNARRAESQVAVRQYEIQQKDLRRQIELQVRRASANLQAAASQAEDSELAVKLSEEELAQARRRFEGGVTGNAEVVEAQAKVAQSRDDRIGVLFAWSQAKVDLAQATGTMASLSLK